MRRKRPLATVGLVSATVAILPLTIALLWACGWYSGVATAGHVTDVAGIKQGTVWEADEEAQTVRVSSNLFGIGAVPFAVTDQTRVVVGDKEGGFGDLYEGTPVRVRYERREAVLVALCVESLSGQTRPVDGASCDTNQRAASID